MKPRPSSPRRVRPALIFTLLSTAVAIALCMRLRAATAHLQPPLLSSALRAPAARKPPTVRGLTCVRGMRNKQTREGIGAFFKLNALAVVLASYYNVDLALPDIISVHGYSFRDLFSKCGPDLDADFPKKCVLVQDDIVHEVCPRADCDCISAPLAPLLQEIVDRGCPVVGVLGDGYKRQEFSGCLSILNRKFSTKGPPPDWQYDAIHYRQGDLEGSGGKAFSKMQLWLLIKQLCRLSNRDIVVVTEGMHEIPECGNRIVIADTSIERSMQIFQHAHHVSVGVSSFAHVLLEMGKPEHIVMILWNARRFEWVNCEKWTLVNTKDGSTWHFDTKAAMLDLITSTRDLKIERKSRPIKQGEELAWERFNLSLPKRIWTPEMMKPAILSD